MSASMRQNPITGNHKQQGTIEVTDIYWAIVFISGWLLYGEIGSIAYIFVYAIAAIWLGSAIGALPIADDLSHESIVRKTARSSVVILTRLKKRYSVVVWLRTTRPPGKIIQSSSGYPQV
jgi:hypothetical protein